MTSVCRVGFHASIPYLGGFAWKRERRAVAIERAFPGVVEIRTAPTTAQFTLTDGTARVPVIAWGTQQIGMGDVVEVREPFRTRLSAGNEVPLDTLEAKFVRLVRAAAQLPGTAVSPP